MIYLKSFTYPNEDQELDFIMDIKRTCYDTYYPFKILSKNDLHRLEFDTITILYGGNGSGKSTALNVIAEKISLHRECIYNKSNFFPDYVKLCDMSIEEEIPENSRIITSDDVFDYMLNIRNLNEGIDLKREELFEDYIEAKYSKFQMRTMADYEQLKKVNNTRRTTQSRYVKSKMMDNVREYSNGESAFRYFTEKFEEDGLYLLDEPENSLSPKRQIELMNYLEESARFFGCQFIISTHSPFLLSMKSARIYNLDRNPVEIERWTNLENVRTYFDFFKAHEHEF